MRKIQLLSIFTLGMVLSTNATAQFSASGGGSAIPASGTGGGNWPSGMPVAPATSTASVLVEVGGITSVEINGLSHTWAGDVHATLSDPMGVEHNLFLRPGYENPAGTTFGTPGDFVLGNYTFVVSGGASLPTVSDGVNIQPGTYNQTFDTGGTVWVSGTNGILNTPLTSISGTSGDWVLKIYDWGPGDTGSFTDWTVNGFEPGMGGPDPGTPYCFGDGTGGTCPCSAFGQPGEGCANTTGTGATLTGTGDPSFGNDTFTLDITGVPGDKPGLVLKGDNQVQIPAGDGILCASGGSLRSHVQVTSAGSTTYTDFSGGPFGSVSNSGGVPTNFQFWYRDPSNTCSGSGFNFTNGWTVTYLP